MASGGKEPGDKNGKAAGKGSTQTNHAKITAKESRAPSSAENQSKGDKSSSVEEKVSQLGDKVSSIADKVIPVGDKVSPVGDKVSSIADKVSPVGDKVSKEGDKVSQSGDKVSSVGDNASNKNKAPGFSWGKLNTRDLLPGQIISSGDTGEGQPTGQDKGSTEAPKTSQSRKSTLVLPATTQGDPDKDGEKLSQGARRDSTFVSLDSVSRRSVDYRLASTTVQPVNNNEEEEKPKSLTYTDDSLIRLAIPYLPVGLAVACLITNILLPGSGTIIGAFSIFCCGKARVPAKDDQVMVTLCVNVWVGVAQFFTIPLFMVGWFWSLAWGVRMVLLSLEHRREQKRQRDVDLQQLALRAFSSPRRSRMPPI